jgi:hypothetical protein
MIIFLGISMSRNVALLLVLLLLAASCLTGVKPVYSSVAAVEDSWLLKASMQQARSGLGVAAMNGKIYAIGGSNAIGPGGDFVGTNEMYDPVTDTWTTKASMPTPRSYFAIAAYQNKIYCIGGVVGFAVDDEHGVFYHEVVSGVNEVYDTVTDTWETKRSLPDGGMVMQAHVVNGKIYVVDGGWVYAYDPNEDSWVTKTVMSKPYPEWDSWPMSAAVDNKIVFTFAYSTFNFSTGETWEQKVMVYDVETDSWSGGTSGQTPSPSPSEQPTETPNAEAIALVSMTIVVVTVVGLLVYFKKRKQ